VLVDRTITWLASARTSVLMQVIYVVSVSVIAPGGGGLVQATASAGDGAIRTAMKSVETSAVPASKALRSAGLDPARTRCVQ
jgi:hypothetical protein